MIWEEKSGGGSNVYGNGKQGSEFQWQWRGDASRGVKAQGPTLRHSLWLCQRGPISEPELLSTRGVAGVELIAGKIVVLCLVRCLEIAGEAS